MTDPLTPTPLTPEEEAEVRLLAATWRAEDDAIAGGYAGLAVQRLLATLDAARAGVRDPEEPHRYRQSATWGRCASCGERWKDHRPAPDLSAALDVERLARAIDSLWSTILEPQLAADRLASEYAALAHTDPKAPQEDTDGIDA